MNGRLTEAERLKAPPEKMCADDDKGDLEIDEDDIEYREAR